MFVDRYGPWALVVGASEGIGAVFAHAVAERGLNAVLVARRQSALDEVASRTREATGSDVRTVAVDLTDDDATAAIIDATAELDVGLVFYCAGADPNYASFLSQPVENAVAMVQRNCVAPLRISHHFAAPMEERGRGGIVLVSSGPRSSADRTWSPTAPPKRSTW
jgi:short-subunit dehydrogenase